MPVLWPHLDLLSLNQKYLIVGKSKALFKSCGVSTYVYYSLAVFLSQLLVVLPSLYFPSVRVLLWVIYFKQDQSGAFAYLRMHFRYFHTSHVVYMRFLFIVFPQNLKKEIACATNITCVKQRKCICRGMRGPGLFCLKYSRKTLTDGNIAGEQQAAKKTAPVNNKHELKPHKTLLFSPLLNIFWFKRSRSKMRPESLNQERLKALSKQWLKI